MAKSGKGGKGQSSSTNHVDKIEIQVTGFPEQIAIQTFELSVAINTIPCITLSILPIRNPKKGKGQYVTASSPTIKDLTDLYSSLLSKAVDLKTTATIKIKFTPPDDIKVPLEKKQEITLKDWILTDAGISSISSTAAPILAITFCHPIVKLDKTGMIYENISNMTKLATVYSDASGNKLISYMDSIYKAFSSETDIEFLEIAEKNHGGPSDERFKTLVKKFRERDLQENLPSKYIVDATSGFFLAYTQADITDESLKNAIGPLIAPTAFGKSTWQKLISEVCPTLLVQIIPTYDKERLRLEPFSPWQSSSYTINTSLISSFDMASIDPNPIIGTAISKDSWSGGNVIDGSDRDPSKANNEDNSFAFYFPDKVAYGDVNGDILNVSESSIIDNIMTTIIASNSNIDGDDEQGDNLENAGSGIDDYTRTELEELYAKALFQINYRKNCRSNIVAIPFFIYKDEPMYPGRVLSVYDDTTKTNIFSGYITRIIIKGESMGGCMTMIELSHTRAATDSGSENKLLIEEGSYNPCYL